MYSSVTSMLMVKVGLGSMAKVYWDWADKDKKKGQTKESLA